MLEYRIKKDSMNERIVKHGIAKIMLYYWILVILWQTFRFVENRSLMDSLVKISLFGIVLLHSLYNRDTRHSEKITALLVLFSLTQFITIIRDTLSIGSVITIVFMFMQIIVFLIMQRDEEISEDSLDWLGMMIILVGVIMGLYSIFFKTQRFVRAFTSAGSYGSECKSFLYSNHEYGLYLSAGIIFAVRTLFRKRSNVVLSAFVISFLAANLISTFSRTAIIGCVVGVIILSFAIGGKRACHIFLAIGIAICLITLDANLRSFFFRKILKNSITDSGSVVDKGRASMYRDEWLYFLSGSSLEKLFGRGYNGNRAAGHDAYLMILNTGGICEFLFFAAIILWSFYNALISFRIHRETGALCFALQTLVLLYMIAQTPILFYSTMDSFFITMLFVLIPLYVSNHLKRLISTGRVGLT